MRETESLKFNFDFEHKGLKGIAYIIPVAELTDEERISHRIRESSFLIHLFEPDRCISFELFIGEDLEWQTSASPMLVDRSVVNIIGRRIDSKCIIILQIGLPAS